MTQLRLKSPLVLAVLISLALHALVSFYLSDPIEFSHHGQPPAPIVEVTLKSIPMGAVHAKAKMVNQALNALSQDYERDFQAYQDQINAGQKFLLPPAAKVSYLGYVSGIPITGGQVDWQPNQDQYALRVKITLPFFGDFLFSSVGKIDAYGLAPELYEERRGARGDRLVTLQRDQGIVSFSVNREVAPLPLGTQDRFSILFQLAGLVGGDPQVDAQGVAREIPIASIDMVETWVFMSLGDEVISQNNHEYNTRHFVRLPRDPEDKRRIEVWLSESDHYLPIKMRQSEANGTTYELVANAVLYP